MRGAARKKLDRIDLLPVGSGIFEAYGFARGTLAAGSIGAGVDYERRITERTSAFAQAEGGYEYSDNSSLFYQALTGVRVRFE